MSVSSGQPLEGNVRSRALLRYGETGDWQFRRTDGRTATGWWLKIGIWLARIRPIVCYYFGCDPLPYSRLPEYSNLDRICRWCHRNETHKS